MKSLEGKVALITGGSRGIGRGVALTLVSEGARVAICGRTGATLEKTREEIEQRGGEVLAIECDVADREGRIRLVEQTVEHFGTIDILINNAALVPAAPLLEADEATIDAAWETGPKASLHLMQLCHPHLKGNGAIVNVSSGAAIADSLPDRGVYAAVKSALNAFSRHAANEWAKDGIRVNTIMPIARSENFAALLDSDPELERSFSERIPLGRLGDCESDIGPAVAFLVGPASGYITGAIIPLDGGSSYPR